MRTTIRKKKARRATPLTAKTGSAQAAPASVRQQSQLLDIALNTMSQGLVMFDSAERVVLCNRRYVELSGLPADFLRPGRTLRELLTMRQANGSFSADIEQYRDTLREDLAAGKHRSLTVKTRDGRWHRVTNVPMDGGGWVATHEDITQYVLARALIEKQKLHLDAAIENMTQGISMFDADQRLIVCNRQYADIYGLDAEHIRPGTSLAAILEYQLAVGNAPVNTRNYVPDRLNKVANQQPYVMSNRLKDGRLIQVVHRPLDDGGWVTTHDDITESVRREETFKLLFDSSPMPMWVTDRSDLRFLAVNEAALSHYGYSREQFMAMSVPDIRPREDREKFVRDLRTYSNDDLLEITAQHAKADGSTIDVCVYARALMYDGHAARLAAIHDITRTVQTEQALTRTKKFLDTVIEHMPMPVIVKDIAGMEDNLADARFTYFNRAYEELTGDVREELIGKTARQIYDKDRADVILRADHVALHSNNFAMTSEHPISTVSKGTRMITASKTVIRDENGKPQYMLTVVDDVTERREAEKRIRYLAHIDALTDLPNRTTFVEHLDKAILAAGERGQRFAILCIDLDRFKEANDIYGHLTGDALLREVARRLKAAAGGVFLARVGGDEFTIVIHEGLQPDSAKAIGERLLSAFQNDFEIDGHRLQIGISIGGAVFPEDGADAKTLLANADAALYQAKTESRGSLRFFEAELGLRLRERRELESDLRDAIHRQDLFLHFQPQWNIASKKAIGLEALLRWNCAKRGMVSPGVFIPIAEESRLIIPLGEWVLREACREAASWPRPLNIAVNISPVQFRHGNLPQLIHSILLETGLKPARLELEITEGVLIDDFPRAISLLRQLKALGVGIAIDDFGSGYSSLSYLHAFPFGKIKIDQSFVGDLETNRQSMAIVRAIVTLGHNLNIPVLAEGVETEFQRNFLYQENCDEMQGYLAGRPQAIDGYAPLVGRDLIRGHTSAAAR